MSRKPYLCVHHRLVRHLLRRGCRGRPLGLRPRITALLLRTLWLLLLLLLMLLLPLIPLSLLRPLLSLLRRPLLRLLCLLRLGYLHPHLDQLEGRLAVDLLKLLFQVPHAGLPATTRQHSPIVEPSAAC